MAGDARRPGGNRGKKRPTTGTGGHGRKALEGKGPTPKAEDRVYHQAHKRKQAAERLAAKRGETAPRKPQPAPRRKAAGDELVTGRNAVLEALRAKVPATTLYLASRAELDDRLRETISIANHRDLPVLEVMRPELDRLTGNDLLHQGVALAVRPYEYAHPLDLLERAGDRAPLVVALDGVTDPRNLGAVIRSAAAFGAHGVVLPQRRSAGVTAAVWRASAGAVARLPVAMASNLAQTISAYKQRGVFVAGLAGDGDVLLPAFDLADRPLLVVAGSEGEGLSRIVRELCDVVVSIPIGAATESLNASVAASIALYTVAQARAAQ
ncbi:MAG TPA: 23S rRNA (guanosine(2251)-2'-O)-methyltransferase RlmB [Amnibacterium sp.]|jgi:23S rRNA (guanosine2251-2'-O)-methyltransferase|nr:23S rRNA (guanosine(2251)-2'-O)-methyltransferase RlmB [Amnibacterium sp.]